MKKHINTLCLHCFILLLGCAVPFLCSGEDRSLRDIDIGTLSVKAEAGDVAAQYWLGNRYYYGFLEVRLDNAQAVEWFQKAADGGDARAQAKLGYMYVTARGVPANSKKGFDWLHCAAAQENRQAQYYLGTFYEKGRGVEPDRFEAMDWYIKSAAKGHRPAKTHLKRMREQSDAVRMGTASNAWWQVPLNELIRRAESGDAKAQCDLGVRYNGYGGTPIDFEKALYWLEQAAVQTNLSAHYSLALLHTRTDPVRLKKAFHHCRIAAQGGRRNAQNTLARFYRDGIGTEPDRKQALHWYQQAEQAGHSSAARNIYSLMKGRAKKLPMREEYVSAREYRPPKITLLVRNFENREVDVRLVAYNPEQKTVQIEPALGQVDTLPLSAFHKDSHPLIRESVMNSTFKKLGVRMKRKSLSQKECEQAGKISGKKGPDNVNYEGVVYRVTLKNNGDARLEDLSLDYRFYYKEDFQITDFMGSKTDGSRKHQWTARSFEIDDLAAGKEHKLETNPFFLTSYVTDDGIYFPNGRPTKLSSNPEGFWVRVSRKTVDGCTVYRDISSPSSLSSKLEW